jgi:hypothetical protein
VNITNPAGLVTTTITYAMTGDEGTADAYGSIASLVFDGLNGLLEIGEGIVSGNLAAAGTAALAPINDLVQMGTDSVSPPQGPGSATPAPPLVPDTGAGGSTPGSYLSITPWACQNYDIGNWCLTQIGQQ